MTATENGQSPDDKHRRDASGLWHLGKTEKGTISAATVLVAIACGLGQYIQLSVRNGIESLGVALCISAAGCVLIIISVRIIESRKHVVTIRLLPAVALLAAASLAGIIAGVFIGHFAFAAT
jgi:hypothetical protein